MAWSTTNYRYWKSNNFDKTLHNQFVFQKEQQNNENRDSDIDQNDMNWQKVINLQNQSFISNELNSNKNYNQNFNQTSSLVKYIPSQQKSKLLDQDLHLENDKFGDQYQMKKMLEENYLKQNNQIQEQENVVSNQNQYCSTYNDNFNNYEKYIQDQYIPHKNQFKKCFKLSKENYHQPYFYNSDDISKKQQIQYEKKNIQHKENNVQNINENQFSGKQNKQSQNYTFQHKRNKFAKQKKNLKINEKNSKQLQNGDQILIDKKLYESQVEYMNNLQKELNQYKQQEENQRKQQELEKQRHLYQGNKQFKVENGFQMADKIKYYSQQKNFLKGTTVSDWVREKSQAQQNIGDVKNNSKLGFKDKKSQN
ncbi:hypothetical protein PPERSA_04570 [Pseudocohnilembus persalinus]|uniref:Uncharacterized protein n=1 Tax=Pseudocohnilembus persalinus TaxID=266149 RepID=A0A0V0QEA0_PSEPJ|nr:hypothetical protein PPERSA_04570 [Pseudocohnilembus persalinus]|eukprot:KRX00549.1 hypothetical protein PPERSA_04570 [Pseudocohnilembus persalinus]